MVEYLEDLCRRSQSGDEGSGEKDGGTRDGRTGCLSLLSHRAMNDMAVFLCSQSLLVAQLFNGASADAGRGRLTKPEGHWRVLLCLLGY